MSERQLKISQMAKDTAHYILCGMGPSVVQECNTIEAIQYAMDHATGEALRRAAVLCAGVSPFCGPLKDEAIRACISVIHSEAAKLTKS